MIHKLESYTASSLDTYTVKERQISIVKRIENRIRPLFVNVLGRWETLCLVIGFLLGRAIILENLSPFIVPFFAVILALKPKKRAYAFFSLVGGAATIGVIHALYALTAVLLYWVLRGLCVNVLKREELKVIPYIVFLSASVSRVGFHYFTSGGLEATQAIMGAVEAGMGLLLTLIFLYSVPLVASRVRKKSLKNEEIICLIILLASVITGTIGWTVFGAEMDHIFSRYAILAFAYVGGATIGATVGVVIGLIISLANVSSLYQMSLLAFSGLLGGLLREGKKTGVGMGLIIGTLLIGLYGGGYAQLPSTTMSSGIAVILFLITPNFLFNKMAVYIPGTQAHTNQQQQYLKKLRDVTAGRVEQFSNLFYALSSSFSSPSDMNEDDESEEVDMFLSKVTERTCQTCFLKERCWVKKFDQTYDYMQQIMTEVGEEPSIKSPKLKRDWRKHCVKPDRVVQSIYEQQGPFHEQQQLKQRIHESRRLVGEQLLGVSQVMGDFAKEIQRERDTHQQQEDQILDKLQEIGLDVENVDIYNLEEGSVDIDMTIHSDYHEECEKIIAPILSDILSETVVVKKHIEAAFPNGYGQVTFGSAKTYELDTGAAHAAKGGGWISGDNYETFELGAGKQAIAISDGMGNGERAHVESQETLKLLSKVLKSGIDETVAIKSINSILSLRSTDEIFSTLDLALVDMQDAKAKFLKIGSTPSFIKRGEKVIKVEASNLPMGMVREFDVEVVDEQLKSGDLLIMMSDGIFEGPNHIENNEIWIKRKIKEIQTDDPQDVADLLLEEVIRTKSGAIDDDMTVVVSKIEHHLPKWAAISTYTNDEKLERQAQ